MKKCTNCNTLLPEDRFFPREDRPELYAWCKNCMNEQKRSQDYPEFKLRNPGIFEYSWRQSQVS
jgi:hypothetical protein